MKIKVFRLRHTRAHWNGRRFKARSRDRDAPRARRREFNRYLTKVGVTSGKDIVTYSLRHALVDRARKAGFLDPVIAIVVGTKRESKKTMTAGYGVERQGTMDLRRQIVEAVTYPALAPV